MPASTQIAELQRDPGATSPADGGTTPAPICTRQDDDVSGCLAPTRPPKRVTRRHGRDVFPDILAIDFETANSGPESACAIGATLMRMGELVDEAYWLIRPPSKQFAFSWLHGITWTDVRNAPLFPDVIAQLTQQFPAATAFMAHNASFDARVMRACRSYYALGLDHRPFFCTVVGARKAWPELANHKLSTVAQHLQVRLQHHHAGSDARACARIGLAVPPDLPWFAKYHEPPPTMPRDPATSSMNSVAVR